MVKLARASALNFGVNIVETLVGAIGTLYFARLLGAGSMGSYFLALGLVNWLLIPAGGVSTAALKRISEGEQQNRFFTAGLLLQFVYLSAVLGAILLATEIINLYVEFEGARLIGGFFVLLGISRFANACLRGENRVELASLLNGSRTFARVGFQLGFVILSGLGLAGLLAGEILAAAVISIVTLAFIRPRLVRPRREQFVRLYEYGRYSWFGSLKVNAYSWTDTLVLGFFVSTAAVGTYEIAWRVSALFILLPGAMGNTVFPTISKHARKEETEAIQRILERMLPFAPALAIPGAVGALVIGPQILALYGPEFTDGAIFLLVLSMARIIEAIERLFERVLNAMDYPERAFRVAVIFIIVNTLLNVLLVLLIGVLGAAVATFVSMIVSLGLAWYYLPSSITPKIPAQAIAAQFISAVVMGGAIHALLYFRPPTNDWEIITYVVSGAIIYSFGVFLSSALARDILRQLVDEIFA